MKKISTYLHEPLFEHVQSLAEQSSLPLSIFVRMILADYVRCENSSSTATEAAENTAPPVKPQAQAADGWLVHSNKLLRVRA